MEIVYLPKAEEDLKYWKKSGQKHIQIRITNLIQAIKQNPFEGIGKPEALKYNWSGMWSRRIDWEHRIIYEVKEQLILIHSLRNHY